MLFVMILWISTIVVRVPEHILLRQEIWCNMDGRDFAVCMLFTSLRHSNDVP